METALFLTCLDSNSNTTSASWLRKIKAAIVTKSFQRAVTQGDTMDTSATPIYASHVRLLNRAYALEGSPDAATRKFALTCLQRAVGRSAELASCILDNVVWDEVLQCAFIEIIQTCVCVRSSIMYYKERRDNAEMHPATHRLEGVMVVRCAQQCY